MRIKSKIKSPAAACTIACLAASAFTLSASATTAESPFVFSTPEVTKIDWNARCLRSADMDGDGKKDLIVINNDTAKIEIHLQREPGAISEQELRSVQNNRWEPVLEDSRFLEKSIVIAQFGYALEIGDFNNDGKQDIAFTGNNDPLTVLLQGDDIDDWSEQWTFTDMETLQWISTLAVSDLNADGLQDLAVLSENEIFLFFQQADAKELPEPKRYKLAADNPYGLMLMDLDGNGLRDIRYLANGSDRPFRMRLQLADGTFGPEQSFELEITSASIRPLPVDPNEAARFVYIHDRTRQIELSTLTRNLKQEEVGFTELHPLIYSAVLDGDGSSASTMADFNGDGLLDIVMANSGGAEVLLFIQSDNGVFNEAISFPSFDGITGLAAGDANGDGRAELFIASKDEELVGYTQLDTTGRMPFPELITTEDEWVPINVTTEDFDGDGLTEVAVLLQNDKDVNISIFQLSKNAEDRSAEATATIDVGKLKRDPGAMRAIHLNDDTLPDILLNQQRDPAMVFVQKVDSESGKTEWIEAAKDSSLRESQLNKIDLANIISMDMDADGKREILVAREGFARSLQFNDAGELTLLDQFNARSSEDSLASPVAFDINADGQPELFFWSSSTQSIQMLKRDDKGIYRYAESLELGALNLLRAEFATLGTDNEPHFILFGSGQFLALPLRTAGWQLENHVAYETDLKDVTYTSLEVGDFNNDGKVDLLVLDAQNHIIEMLERDANGDWQSGMHFTVFDVNLHYQGRTGAPQEPREVAVGDFTSDGKTDFAILVHDRMLLYSQE